MAGRRGNNEGSIFQRANGRWAAYISVDGRRQILYGKTRPEVASKLTDALKSRDAGIPVIGSKETLGTFLPRWLEAHRHRVRPRVWDRYEQLVRIHALPTLSKVPVAKLTQAHLQSLYAERMGRGGRSPSLVHHLHMALHKALGDAVRWGLAVRNVADLVDPPRMPRKEMEVLNADQVRTLLATEAEPALRALLTVAVTTGMRQGEILGLRWSDVDVTRGVVAIRGSLQRSRGQVFISEPKTARSRRQVELSGMAIAALTAERTRQRNLREDMPDGWNPLDLVFPTPAGTPQHGKTLTTSYHQLLKRAQLPRVRFHDLRHTAATLMLSRGVHPKIVSEMLGHANIAITLDLYSHVTPTMQREAASAMDSLLSA